MTAVRFVSLVALAMWVGGLATLGLVAAPVLFDVLVAHDPERGRTIAGLAFGAVFEADNRLTLFLGAVVAASLAWRAARGQRPRGLVWRSAVLAAMIAMAVVTGAVIGPRIDAIRASAPTAIADLPDTDPVKIEFSRLHGLSGGLLVGTVAGGLALIWMEMRDA